MIDCKLETNDECTTAYMINPTDLDITNATDMGIKVVVYKKEYVKTVIPEGL